MGLRKKLCKQYLTTLDKAKITGIMVVVIDINNLTVINNTHGHHLGDDVIKTVASCLLKTIGTKADV